MESRFEYAAGSVVGREHLIIAKNNQDSHCVIADGNRFVGIICDGCSAGVMSESGAQIFSRLIAGSLLSSMRIGYSLDGDVLEIARSRALAHMRLIAKHMPGDDVQAVVDHFLFTVIGAVSDGHRFMIFALGDGVYALNGEISVLGPWPDNEPPYLAYAITGTKSRPADSESFRFRILCDVDATAVRNAVIGSDGVSDLVSASGEYLPGRGEPVGDISQFWENDIFFRNPDALRRRLVLVNRDNQRIDWESRKVSKRSGYLPDDTTMIVLRKKEVPDEHFSASDKEG